MFGYRSDGRKIKTIDPLFKIIPNIMMERSDAHVYFKQDIPLKTMDEYIDKKAEEGIRITYMDIVYSAIVRIISERPSLNRFAINGVLYARNKIQVSLVIKKSLTDDGEETNLKIDFDGTETLIEVRDKIQATIEENKKLENKNNMDGFVKVLGRIPYGIVRKAIKFFKFLDKHGMLPKFIIELSPFHTSVYLTNVGSLGIDTIYHHLYNFGTTSLFCAMGKKKKTYIYEEDEIREEKCITIGFVGDERICDGYYYASSFKQISRYLKKPELLEVKGERKYDIK